MNNKGLTLVELMVLVAMVGGLLLSLLVVGGTFVLGKRAYNALPEQPKALDAECK